MINELPSEVSFRFSRSGGPGGQSVNKVSTQVELLFNVDESNILSDNQKDTIKFKLAKRINSEGVLILKCDETRSQLKNKQIIINRFILLVKEVLKPVKKRRPTKPTRSSVRKRLDDKKKQSVKKKNRKPDDE